MGYTGRCLHSMSLVHEQLFEDPGNIRTRNRASIDDNLKRRSGLPHFSFHEVIPVPQ
jgi:hypothetical protein